MGAYILRRLLLIIPTLLGIMVLNFALIQFVPGGPIEQVIARMEGGGDVFSSFSGGGASSPGEEFSASDSSTSGWSSAISPSDGVPVAARSVPVQKLSGWP